MFWLIAFLPFTPNSCRQPRRSNYISFSVNLRVWLRGNMRKAHARHVAQARAHAHAYACHTQEKHTHTHTTIVLANVNSAYFLLRFSVG